VSGRFFRGVPYPRLLATGRLALKVDVNFQNPMNAWDSEATRTWFSIIAQNAHHSAAAISKTIWKTPKAQSTDELKDRHDNFLAKWSVYDSLAHSPCFESREKLIKEATAKLASGPGVSPPGAFHGGNFRRHWKLYIEALITEYGAPGPVSRGIPSGRSTKRPGAAGGQPRA
jgi:hypothetical protein